MRTLLSVCGLVVLFFGYLYLFTWSLKVSRDATPTVDDLFHRCERICGVSADAGRRMRIRRFSPNWGGTCECEEVGSDP